MAPPPVEPASGNEPLFNRPVHLIPAGDGRTLCGFKWNDKRALPHVDPRYADRNVRRHGHVVCPDCESAVFLVCAGLDYLPVSVRARTQGA